MKLDLYFEFYYNRRWFYLLILITIIDLALLNLKQMLEVLTAQLLGLGVRSSVTMDEMKATVRTAAFSTQCKVQSYISSNVQSTRKLVKELYFNQSAFVMVADGLSEACVIGRGVRQQTRLFTLSTAVHHL